METNLYQLFGSSGILEMIGKHVSRLKSYLTQRVKEYV